MLDYQLKVTNIHGLIGIRKNDAVLSLSQPRAKLNIETEPAQVNIHTTQAQVRIDQSQCFSEAGLKDVFELTEEFADSGRQTALEAIARIVAEGNRMANIKIKADAVGEIAADKVFRQPDQYDIALIPKSRPKIDFVGGISLEPQPGRISIEAVLNPAQIEATAPSLNYYWQKHPFFSFKFVGKNVDVNA